MLLLLDLYFTIYEIGLQTDRQLFIN